MLWVRKRQALAGRLALLALALQLVLGFGHHPHDLAAGPLAPVAAAHPDGGAAGPAAPEHDDERSCAICAVVHLAGTAFAVAPPALPLPTTFRAVQFAIAAPGSHATPSSRAFHARAPPQV
ncbi:MAG: DUF2946 domain-containing protein [Pseudolabrys sp.]